MIKKVLFFVLSFSGILNAKCCGCCPCCPGGQGGWYGSVGAGYAWTCHSGIKNLDPEDWDPSDEGYDAPLGNVPFFTIGFGKEFCNLYSIDLFYTYAQTCHYEKYQTGPTGTAGRRRTRYFDLDPQNLIANFSICPKNCFAASLCVANVAPVIGVGIGVGINTMSNFHTIAFDEASQTGSTNSIGFSRTTTSFAWQATGGLRFFRCCSPFSLDMLYRYYDGGRFLGPSTIVSNSPDDSGALVNVSPWKGRLRANIIMFTLNYLF